MTHKHLLSITAATQTCHKRYTGMIRAVGLGCFPGIMKVHLKNEPRILVFEGGWSLPTTPPFPPSKTSICGLFSRVVASFHVEHTFGVTTRVGILIDTAIQIARSSLHQENSNVLFLTYFFFFVPYYKFKARKRQPISSFFFLFIKGRKRQ